MDFNHYFSNEEIDRIIHAWQQSHPDLLSVTPLGESYEKRPIWLLTLTNQATGSAADKPAIWIDANIHATELAGTTTALCIADHLLTKYATDPHVTDLLDTSTVYIAPRLNPDGAALAMADQPAFIRSGVRAYPWDDRDTGLHDQDIDGDGRILQMRLIDPHGDWKISTLNPRLMEKRQPHETGGTYYRLLPEGLIENYDGYTIKLAHSYQGLDFNRNFPFDWRPENEQEGSGPFPTSEPEIRAVVNFISSHPNINFAITYHTYSRVLLRPYSNRPDDDIEIDDLFVYKKIGQIGTDLTGYRCVSTFHDFKYHPKEVTTGAFDDWIYDQYGIYSYTVELWDLPTAAGIKDRKFIEWYRDHPHSEDVQILEWADANSSSETYIDWYDFNHPQLGKIQLGGWNRMYSWRNPPVNLIAAEATGQIPFFMALGAMLPHLTIHELQVIPLGNGLSRIVLKLENTGFLPTNTSRQGNKRQATRPIRVSLELSDQTQLINGKLRQELNHLEGRSNKLDVAFVWEASPTDNRIFVEWVVAGSPDSQVIITISSDRAGNMRIPVSLI